MCVLNSPKNHFCAIMLVDLVQLPLPSESLHDDVKVVALHKKLLVDVSGGGFQLHTLRGVKEMVQGVGRVVGRVEFFSFLHKSNKFNGIS